MQKEYLALLLMMAGGEGNAFPGSFEKVLEVADMYVMVTHPSPFNCFVFTFV